MAKRNIARIVAVAVFLSDVIVLIVVLALLWSMSSRTDKQDRCEMLCFGLHCDCRTEALQQHLGTKFTTKFSRLNTKRQRAEKENSRNGYALMQKQGYIWSIKPIARLSGSKQNMRDDEINKTMMSLRNWEVEGRSYSYVRNGMGYRNGRLVAPVKGFYHIYSFLDLFLEYVNREGENMMKFDKEAAIQHAVYKFNIRRGEEEKVLSTYKPYQYSQNGRFNFYETYISADVELEAGDEVYIKVTNISYVKNPSKNYFGMHML